jgi:glycosyltransferase involved in cell wall biosynthesis
MKILQVHNFYQQAGGEDRVVAAERAMLTGQGHDVFQYTVHNDQVNGMPVLQLGIKTVWNQKKFKNIGCLMDEQGIELVHVHNTLPLISPAVYYAAAARKTPVIQTLHNYRLLCPAGTLFRQGNICELCLHKEIKFPAIQHRCYRGSLLTSAAVSTMLAGHALSGTYQRRIHTYIALTQFARNKFCEGGLPAERIVVKPNFLAEDPGAGCGKGGYALFVGRLTEEKGLATLLDAWGASPQAIPLKIVGDGSMQALVRQRAAALGNVEYLGACEHDRVIQLLQDAEFLVFPSRWYEGMPIVILEALACGTPVVAFGLGSMNELILDGVNGIKLPFPDTGALTSFLHNSGDPMQKVVKLRTGARAHFERYFTAKTNYGLLLDIYDRALNQPRSVS